MTRPHAGDDATTTPVADLADDRGDVPGWVLITLMTAGLVVLLWSVAGPLLQNVFTQAIDRVTSF
ncbi:hypothetical protein BFL36_00590 [Clavibacter michiganensis]|uniref:Uncharacterized protein n=1 Tax=Clavibacter michiganensis TaxID=28447 RepID=A0A251YWX4_9MICO|nr:hypothetical protein [Clavibacter michiganensis]OUE28740.1 hypothetical protein BFL36_00590 [Clavibacter michiganensis]